MFFLRCLLVVGLTTTLVNALSRESRMQANAPLFRFPYLGHGDPDHSFRHPYQSSPHGDAIDGWVQLGTAIVTRSVTGRDVCRLTSSSQANQGVVYNIIRTTSNNFNGYIDIQMDSARDSHEAADGMGFFFTKDKPQLGSAMGMSHTFQGLGLIVDTFSNSRTRRVPYMYAYVSDGMKSWNPDTDGSDSEITRGCQLEMNSKIRIYIQYVDEELHVGVAMNARSPQKWHTCFKATNVKLPFSGGGYFAFAGETGHFFALHEVHDAVFIDEADHTQGHGTAYEQEYYGTTNQDQRTEEKHHVDQGPTGHSHTEEKKEDERKHATDPDPGSRIHRGQSATDSLSGSLDLQVYEVFNSMASSLRQLGDHESGDTKLRLDGVRDITAHLIVEMQKQKTDLGNLIGTLRHLKNTAGDLTYTSDRFTEQLRGLHSSIAAMRDTTDNMANSHDDMHEDLINHHMDVVSKNKGGKGPLVMFLVIQVLLVAAIYFVNKMHATTRKLGRMV